MSLRVALRAWMARRLADPAFQRFAIRLPLTRPIARRRALTLFRLATGFVGSQVLLATLRTGVLDALRDGPQTQAALAAATGLAPDRLDRLLDAAGPLGLVRPAGRRRDGVVVLGEVGAALLGNPSARAMIEHHDAFYRDLATPELLLRPAPDGPWPETGVAALWRYAAGQRAAATQVPEAVREPASPGTTDYSALMTRTQDLLVEDVLDTVSLADCRLLLDVGGGEGSFAMAALRRHPRLRATVFDLPEVAGAAADAAVHQGFGGRLDTRGGSFLTDPLPGGADVITLVRVVHDHDDASVRVLFERAREALPAGGRVVIAEPLAGAAAAVDAYFAAYFLAMGQGRLRDRAELEVLLKGAGFGDVQRRRTRLPLLVGVVTARAL